MLGPQPSQLLRFASEWALPFCSFELQRKSLSQLKRQMLIAHAVSKHPGEPIRPIDPAAWVSHTAAMTGVYPAYGMSPSMSTVTSTSSSISSSIPETERESCRRPRAAFVLRNPNANEWINVYFFILNLWATQDSEQQKEQQTTKAVRIAKPANTTIVKQWSKLVYRGHVGFILLVLPFFYHS